MSGAGKWVKKNPALAMGLLAVGTGGLGLAGIGPLAALGAAGAAGTAGAAGAAAAGGAAPLGLGTGALFGAEAGVGAGLLAPTTAGAMGSSILAPAVAAEGLGGGFAGLAGGASPLAAEAAMSSAPMSAWDKFGAGMDKFGKYAKLANQANGLLGPQEQQSMPQIAPPQLRGPGASLNPTPMYGGSGGGLYGVDPEEEKRRAYMAYLAQQGVA